MYYCELGGVRRLFSSGILVLFFFFFHRGIRVTRHMHIWEKAIP